MESNKLKITGVIRYLLLTCVIITGLISIIATGGGDGDSGATGGTADTGGTESETGTLSISLTDAATDDFKAVYVTIQEVSVHISVDEQNAGENQENGENEGDETGYWEVVGEPNRTYNLLELVNGVLEELGVSELEAEHCTQIRLLLGEENDGENNILGVPHPENYSNYVVTDADEYVELQVASGYETGIKLIHGFDIESGVVTELVLDFDAEKSIMKIGNGRYKLKPTIKVIDVEVASTVSGIITDGTEPIAGALVSAQVYDDSATDKKDEVLIKASTITDEEGGYRLILDAGTYNIVAYKDGYTPECTSVVLESETDITDEDFTLTGADTGTISGDVTITSGEEDQSVDISIRQSSDCGDAGSEIEIASDIVSDGGTYGITLPAGTYSLVASTEDYDTLERTIEITSGSDLELNLTFPGTVPSISNLSYDPTESPGGNGIVSVIGSVDFIDDDGNVLTLIHDIFDSEGSQVSDAYTEVDVQEDVAGLTSGTIDITLDFDTDSQDIDDYTFVVYIEDEDANQSNVLTGEFIITENPE